MAELDVEKLKRLTERVRHGFSLAGQESYASGDPTLLPLPQLEAIIAALEDRERLRVENDRLEAEDLEIVQKVADLEEDRDRLRAKDHQLRELVDRQAEDEGLWFIAATAPEAYLQQELRKLHAALEDRA